MAIDRKSAIAPASPSTRALSAHRLTGGGTRGNARLTAATGTVLLCLLAVIGVTLLQLRQLLFVHLFVGMLLIGPVLLKLSSTGYRFMRYYTADRAYRLKGPPPIALRVIAPIVIVSTLVVFVSGVALLFIGPSSRATLLPIHKVSFIVWAAFTGVHVLAHLSALPREVGRDYGRAAELSSDVSGRAGRVLAQAAALVAGLVLALLVLPEFGAWLQATHGVDGG